MKGGDSIDHIGRVSSIDGNSVFVRITSQSACGTCAARKACGMSESAEKVIEVVTSSPERYSTGDEVVVSVRRRVGITAVAIAYLAPLVVLLCIIAGADTLGLSDGWAAALSLGGVGIYYFLLWAFRERISNRVNFIIHKI